MTDLPVLSVMERYPALLYLVVLGAVFLYLGRVLSEASEAWSKVLGPLGRRWRNRAERDLQRQRKAEAAGKAESLRQHAHQEAIVEDLRRQLDYVNPRIEALYAEVTALHDYLAMDAGWHAAAEVHLATLGVEMPPPPHQTYREWRATRDGAH